MTESNPRFAQVIRRHLDVHFVSNADADEILAHFSRNVGEDFVAIGQGHSKHGSGQDLRYRAGNLNRFFFRHRENCLSTANGIGPCAANFNHNTANPTPPAEPRRCPGFWRKSSSRRHRHEKPVHPRVNGNAGFPAGKLRGLLTDLAVHEAGMPRYWPTGMSALRRADNSRMHP